MRKNLSDKLKEQIKANPGKYTKKNLSGEALTYANRVKGAAKSRALKAKNYLHVPIGGKDDKALVVKKGAPLYAKIVAGAKDSGLSVKEFIKRNKAAILKLRETGRITIAVDGDKLMNMISNLKRRANIYINDLDGYEQVSRVKSLLRLQMFQTHVFSLTNIFKLIYEVEVHYKGDIRFYCPKDGQYENLFEPNEIKKLLDNFDPEIKYIESDRKSPEE